MKVLFLLIFSCLHIEYLSAQISNSVLKTSNYTTQIEELTIGDLVPPDLEVNNIINYKTTKFKFSDFKGKLLILDFWATWCAPCLSAIPKLDSLQKYFKDQIQIFPISYEDKNIVKEFLLKRQKITGNLIFTATNDKLLTKIFKHTYLPHYVWINGDGKIVAITSSDEVTKSNIEKVLNGKIDGLLTKDDPAIKYNYGLGKLFFAPSVEIKNFNSGEVEVKRLKNSEFIFHSILTRYTEGAVNGTDFDSLSLVTRNNTVLGLYKIAMWKGNLSGFSDTKTFIDIKDPKLYTRLTSRGFDGEPFLKSNLEAISWQRENCFSYEIKVPQELKNEMYDIMLEQINLYFKMRYGIEGTIEKRKQRYLSLTCNNCSSKIATKGGGPTAKVDKYSIYIINQPISQLINSLFIPLQHHPLIIDETNLKGNIDLNILSNISNLEELNEELSKIGLKLIEKEMEMKVGVIKQVSR